MGRLLMAAFFVGVAYFGIWVNVPEDIKADVLGVTESAQELVVESAEETGLRDQLEEALGRSTDEFNAEVDDNETLSGLRDTAEGFLEDDDAAQDSDEDDGVVHNADSSTADAFGALPDDAVGDLVSGIRDEAASAAEGLGVDLSDAAELGEVLDLLPEDTQDDLMNLLRERLIEEADAHGIRLPTEVRGESSAVAASATPAGFADSNAPEYNRDNWRHWDNWERSCWTVREQVLADESLIPVTGEDSNGRQTDNPNELCSIERGLWWNAFSGDGPTAEQDSQFAAAVNGDIGDHFYTNPSDLDIDHVVALSAAYRAGGWAWDETTKRDFANWLDDERHLIAVSGTANRSKSDRVPTPEALNNPGESSGDGWVPGNAAFHCQYATDWSNVKTSWGLEFSDAEEIALASMLSTC